MLRLREPQNTGKPCLGGSDSIMVNRYAYQLLNDIINKNVDAVSALLANFQKIHTASVWQSIMKTCSVLIESPATANEDHIGEVITISPLGYAYLAFEATNATEYGELLGKLLAYMPTKKAEQAAVDNMYKCALLSRPLYLAVMLREKSTIQLLPVAKLTSPSLYLEEHAEFIKAVIMQRFAAADLKKLKCKLTRFDYADIDCGDQRFHSCFKFAGQAPAQPGLRMQIRFKDLSYDARHHRAYLSFSEDDCRTEEKFIQLFNASFSMKLSKYKVEIPTIILQASDFSSLKKTPAATLSL
jgi:hypothetical protein